MDKYTVEPKASKAYKGIAMEGFIATWYAKTARRDEEFRMWASRVSEAVAAGSHVLEVAPGPGYLSVELAKLDKYQVTGLDVSRSFVEFARTNARKIRSCTFLQRLLKRGAPSPVRACEAQSTVKESSLEQFFDGGRKTMANVAIILVLLVTPYLVAYLFQLDGTIGGRVGIFAVFLFTAIDHFFKTESMLPMLPPFVPARRALIYLSGAVEVLFAIAVPTARSILCWSVCHHLSDQHLSLEHLRRHSTGSVRRTFDGTTILVRKTSAASVADILGLLVYRQGTLKRPNHALQPARANARVVEV